MISRESEFGLPSTPADRKDLHVTFQTASDLIDASKAFNLDEVQEGEVVHAHTTNGSLSFSVPGERNRVPGMAKMANIVASDINELSAGDRIRIDGASPGGSVVKLGFLGPFCGIAYSKFPTRELTVDEVDWLNSEGAENKARIIKDFPEILNVYEDAYYVTFFDGVLRLTGELLRAERQKPQQESVTIFN